MRRIILIAHNLRSTHNVGSLLRTADGLGVEKVYFTGYTPYPESSNDERLPHLSRKIDAQIAKTALGAEQLVSWQHRDDIEPLVAELKAAGFFVAALEQTKNSVSIADFSFPDNVALVVGREVEGIEPEVIKRCDQAVEIPMSGKKESFNVAQAAAMALYNLKFT